MAKGKGCERCGNTGFSGRLSISEVIDVTEEVRGLILSNGNANEIEDLAVKQGMVPMFCDGMIKTLKGLTTIEDVLRVMRE